MNIAHDNCTLYIICSLFYFTSIHTMQVVRWKGQLLPDIQHNIVSHVWDDGTLGALSLVSKSMQAFVLDDNLIKERKKKLLAHAALQDRPSCIPYDAWQDLQLKFLFNKRGSSLIGVDSFITEKGTKISSDSYFFYGTLAHSAPDNVICFSSVYDHLIEAYYFDHRGYPCLLNMYHQKTEPYRTHIKEHSIRNDSDKLIEVIKDCYIDFEDGTAPMPLGLWEKFNFIVPIAQSTSILETESMKLCKTSGVHIEGNPIVPDMKKIMRAIAAWDKFCWYWYSTKQIPFDKKESLRYAIVAAIGWNIGMYRECINLYTSPHKLYDHTCFHIARNLLPNNTDGLQRALDNEIMIKKMHAMNKMGIIARAYTTIMRYISESIAHIKTFFCF